MTEGTGIDPGRVCKKWGCHEDAIRNGYCKEHQEET